MHLNKEDINFLGLNDIHPNIPISFRQEYK